MSFKWIGVLLHCWCRGNWCSPEHFGGLWLGVEHGEAAQLEWVGLQSTSVVSMRPLYECSYEF